MYTSKARVDLMWFYSGEAEADLGLHGSGLERSTCAFDAVEAADKVANRVIRYAEVKRRLERIGSTRERVLRLAFTPHAWRGLERWYELAGVACMLTDREDVIAASRRVASLSSSDAEALRTEARAVFDGALRAFAA